MSEEIKVAEVQEEKVDQKVEGAEQISIDAGTAFALKLQEFDKKIAESEAVTANLKKEKASYIYDQNVQQIVLAYKERTIKAQIEEEAKKKMSEAETKE